MVDGCRLQSLFKQRRSSRAQEIEARTGKFPRLARYQRAYRMFLGFKTTQSNADRD